MGKCWGAHRERRAAGFVLAAALIALAGPAFARQDAPQPADLAAPLGQALSADHRRILDHLASNPPADPGPWDAALVTLVQQGRLHAEPDDRTRLAGALTAARTQAVAGALVARLHEPGLSPDEDRAIQAVLADLTAASPIPGSPQAWTAWWAGWADATPDAWRRGLVQRLAARAAAAEASLEAERAHLAEAYRRLLSATPDAERPTLINTLIDAESSTLVRTGLELAMRTVLNAGALNADTSAAAARRLQHPDPGVRLLAARLLEQTDPEELARRAGPLLAAGADDDVATVVLRGASRAPAEIGRGAPLIEAFLRAAAESPSPNPGLLRAAAGAVAAAARAGAIQLDDASIARLRAALSGLPPEMITAETMALMLAVGEGRRLVARLRGDDDALAAAAARLLADDPEHLDHLAAAAAERPLLFEHALRGFIAHRPTAAGFAIAAQLPAPDDAVANRLQRELAARMTRPELEAALDLGASSRTLLLREFIERFDPVGPRSTRESAALLELAERAVFDGRAEEAIRLAEAAVVSREDQRRRAMLLVKAHLRTGDVEAAGEEAERGGVEPDVWIAELARLAESPSARAIHDAIIARYADRLSDAQAADVARLAEVIPPTPDDQPASDDNEPG